MRAHKKGVGDLHEQSPDTTDVIFITNKLRQAIKERDLKPFSIKRFKELVSGGLLS
jgi:hypothetical protein